MFLLRSSGALVAMSALHLALTIAHHHYLQRQAASGVQILKTFGRTNCAIVSRYQFHLGSSLNPTHFLVEALTWREGSCHLCSCAAVCEKQAMINEAASSAAGPPSYR